MRSMDRAISLIALGAWTISPLGCTPSTPAPASAGAGGQRSVFTDTVVYRRFCEVPAGRAVDLTKPCLLLDQGRLRPLPPPRDDK